MEVQSRVSLAKSGIRRRSTKYILTLVKDFLRVLVVTLTGHPWRPVIVKSVSAVGQKYDEEDKEKVNYD